MSWPTIIGYSTAVVVTAIAFAFIGSWWGQRRKQQRIGKLARAVMAAEQRQREALRTAERLAAETLLEKARESADLEVRHAAESTSLDRYFNDRTGRS